MTINPKETYIKLLEFIHKRMKKDTLYNSRSLRNYIHEYGIPKNEINKALRYTDQQFKIKRQKTGTNYTYWRN